MNTISAEQFREIERKTLMKQYRWLLDMGLHPESSVRFIRVNNDELLRLLNTK